MQWCKNVREACISVQMLLFNVFANSVWLTTLARVWKTTPMRHGVLGVSHHRVSRTIDLEIHPAVFLTILSLVYANDSMAQDRGGRDLEEITVTGTRVKHKDPFAANAPIQVVDAEDIARTGADSLSELVLDLPANIGSESRTTAFDSNSITGTASFNLRGLGLGSTLTLINGRRMALSSAVALDGSQFADLNSIPLNVVERVEILKDGASAIHGSDAIAGVANIITRDLNGFEIDLRYQTTTEDNQEDSTVSLAWGGGNDSGHVNIFYTYFDRTPLRMGDREFSFGSWQTPLGFPGNFLPVANGLPAGPPMFDPDCENTGNQTFDNFLSVDFTGFPACITNFSTDRMVAQDFVAAEDRHTVYVDGDYALSPSILIKGEYSYARNDVVRAQGGSLPLLLNTPFIPAFHPNNPFGADVIPILISPIPDGLSNGTATFDYETQRLMGGVTVDFSNTWSLDAGIVYSESTTQDEIDVTLANELQLALLGYGGHNCAPFQGPPGVGECRFYNIFGSSLTGPASATSLEMLDFIRGKRVQDHESELWAVDVTVNGDLWETDNGPVAAAFGLQYRKDSRSTILDPNTLAGNWTFFPQGANSAGERDSYAVLAEVAVPVTDSLDLSLAIRYEDYGNDGGDTVDPKIGLGWNATDTIQLRAGYGTSFRAPTPFHLAAVTADAQAAQPFCGSTQNGAVSRIVSGDSSLTPEHGESLFFGFVFNFADRFNASVDYWRYRYEDIITLQSVQGIINSACAVSPTDPGAVDSRITSEGSQVVAVTIPFENAGRIETDGIDIAANYTIDGAMGSFGLSANTSYINSYDVTQADGSLTAGVGLRNRLNFGRPMPEWRSNATLSWNNNRHGASLAVRHISSYIDDDDNLDIDSNLTVDLRYTLSFDDWFDGVEFALGMNNVFDEMPPLASGIGNYDPQVHDPRGRLAYVWLTASF